MVWTKYTITQSPKLLLPVPSGGFKSQQRKMENSDPQDDLSQCYTYLLVKKWPPGVRRLPEWILWLLPIFLPSATTEKNLVVIFFAHLQAAVGWSWSASLPGSRSPVSSASCLKLWSLRHWPSCLPFSGAYFLKQWQFDMGWKLLFKESRNIQLHQFIIISGERLALVQAKCFRFEW